MTSLIVSKHNIKLIKKLKLKRKLIDSNKCLLKIIALKIIYYIILTLLSFEKYLRHSHFDTLH